MYRCSDFCHAVYYHISKDDWILIHCTCSAMTLLPLFPVILDWAMPCVSLHCVALGCIDLHWITQQGLEHCRLCIWQLSFSKISQSDAYILKASVPRVMTIELTITLPFPPNHVQSLLKAWINTFKHNTECLLWLLPPLKVKVWLDESTST